MSILKNLWKTSGQIKEGFQNFLLAKEYTEKISEKRMTVCNSCPKRNGLRCGECGCVLALKTRCMSCECPLQKWLAELDEKQDEELENFLKDENKNN